MPLTRRAFLAAAVAVAVPLATAAAGYPPHKPTIVSDRLRVSNRLILRG